MSEENRKLVFNAGLTIIFLLSLFAGLYFMPRMMASIAQVISNDDPIICQSSCRFGVQSHLYAHSCIEEGITDYDLCIEFIEGTNDDE